jgi:DNA-directed RNA polymerase specialized sigma24 family protein
MTNQYNDDDLTRRKENFTKLYLNAFPVVASFISKRGGSLEQAKDVFQESLVIYYEMVIAKSKAIQVSEKAYILGIARHLWFQEQKREKLSDQTDFSTDEFAILGDEKEEISSEKILIFLETAGQKCMDILRAFYYDKLTLAKISERFGFASTRSATVQKYKCLEKVRDEVKNRKLEYADFTE